MVNIIETYARTGKGAEKLLRSHECYCYQVAYYLLGREEPSLTAAKLALLEVAGDGGFPLLSESLQRERIKRAVITHSLQINKLRGAISKTC